MGRFKREYFIRKKMSPNVNCVQTSLVGEDGFGPSKSKDNRFAVCYWPTQGTLPILDRLQNQNQWSWWTDLNPRHADYKSFALQLSYTSTFPLPDACCLLPSSNVFVNCFCKKIKRTFPPTEFMKKKKQNIFGGFPEYHRKGTYCNHEILKNFLVTMMHDTGDD